MNLASRQNLPFILILVFGVAAPFVFPDYTNEIAVLWMMIVFASTWDILGGQMGYNSLGNIVFFGAGMYICAIIQIGLYYDVAMYTSGARTTHIVFTTAQYFTGFGVGTVVAGIGAAALAIVAGWIVFGLRGPYFAIGTLGLAVASGEIVASWTWVGAASGISMPVFPGGPNVQRHFFYFLLFALAFATLLFVRWLYSTNFGLALNAIRDDEEKAEAMGLHTLRYKRTAWALSAIFLGIAGAIATFNLYMVVMVLLGGKGTLWGPVIGAVIFHTVKEVTWTYLLGWQYIALGALIVITIVYFQQGMAGWLLEKFPDRFRRRTAVTGEQEPALRGGLAPHPESAE
jgi:branched-chain amino acid transport system permease protein